jgi:hypothetical protein
MDAWMDVSKEGRNPPLALQKLRKTALANLSTLCMNTECLLHTVYYIKMINLNVLVSEVGFEPTPTVLYVTI